MVLAVVVSVAAHAALWWLVKDALFLPKETKNVSATPMTGETVEFSIATPSAPGRGSREAGGEGQPARAKPTNRTQTNTPPVQNGEATQETVETTVVDVEIDDAPHPNPLPGGEGVTAPAAQVDDAALVHARLADAARRCYPPAARRFRQQGTVLLSFCADQSGGVIDAAVKESSGASLLDTAALGCVLPAAAPLPREAASHCYAVPVRFEAQ